MTHSAVVNLQDKLAQCFADNQIPADNLMCELHGNRMRHGKGM